MAVTVATAPLGRSIQRDVHRQDLHHCRDPRTARPGECWRYSEVLLAVERDLIRTRTAEGRSRAEAQGTHMGRPPSLTPAQQKEASRRRAQGATLQELARSYNVSRATISRLSAGQV